MCVWSQVVESHVDTAAEAVTSTTQVHSQVPHATPHAWLSSLLALPSTLPNLIGTLCCAVLPCPVMRMCICVCVCVLSRRLCCPYPSRQLRRPPRVSRQHTAHCSHPLQMTDEETGRCAQHCVTARMPHIVRTWQATHSMPVDQAGRTSDQARSPRLAFTFMYVHGRWRRACEGA